MRGFAAVPSTSSTAPTTCPFCRSTSIVTTAKSPDADSYYRCTTCGEIWNAARYETGSRDGRSWR